MIIEFPYSECFHRLHFFVFFAHPFLFHFTIVFLTGTLLLLSAQYNKRLSTELNLMSCVNDISRDYALNSVTFVNSFLNTFGIILSFHILLAKYFPRAF